MSSANNPEEIIQRQLPPFSTWISYANNPEGTTFKTDSRKKHMEKILALSGFNTLLSDICHLSPLPIAPREKYEGKIQGKTLKNNHR